MRSYYTVSGQYTLAAFKNACKRLGNLKTGEINNLVAILKEKNPQGINESTPCQFNPDVMYDVFMMNDVCRKICEKSGYTYWDQIAERSKELEKSI